MTIKNSRVRLLRRRKTALNNFKILTKTEYAKKYVSDDGWGEYRTQKRIEQETLEARTKVFTI